VQATTWSGHTKASMTLDDYASVVIDPRADEWRPSGRRRTPVAPSAASPSSVTKRAKTGTNRSPYCSPGVVPVWFEGHREGEIPAQRVSLVWR
jgi:hypothetical protein